MPDPAVLEGWRSAQAVCFDVDSTVSPEEGIDVLAGYAGVAQQVSDLTRRAMEGGLPFHEALHARLAIIRPSLAMIAGCLAAHPPRLNVGISQLVARLRAGGAHVYLVSGGFEPMIMPLARALGIPASGVFANQLRFTEEGEYAGFDSQRPTAQAGGKAAVLFRLKRQFGYHPLVMVGDGATDLEAKPPADFFIGYGGVVVREKVRTQADWFVTDFTELLTELGAA
jgi:phosphoserine phosphatase